MERKNIQIRIVLVGLSLLLSLCGLFGAYLFFSGDATFLTDSFADTIQTPTPLPTLTPKPTRIPPTATPNPAVFVAAPCAFEIPKEAQVDCGFVVVPEDRRRPERTIKLAVAIYHSVAAQPADDPVIFLQGGPGAGALEWAASAYPFFIVPILQERDFIVFDQRGTGLSAPALDCDELWSVYFQDLKQQISAEVRAGAYAQALVTCRNRLTSDGTQLWAYTTATSAADVNDVLFALGYSRANLYGASYGTRVAQMVMRSYPESVRSAVLDSVVPLEVKMFDETAAVSEGALQTLFAGCAADPACQTAYPQLEKNFSELKQQFDAQPVSVTVTLPGEDQTYQMSVNGTTLTGAILWSMGRSDLIPTLPQSIHRMRDGNYSALSYALALPPLTLSNLSLGAYISINCHDQVYATTPEKIEAVLAAQPKTEALGLSGVFASGQALFDICRGWGAAPLVADENQPLTTDIPALVVAGQYDPITPPAFARQLAGHLSHSYLFEFSNVSHTPTVGSDSTCPLNTVLAFLHDPATEPSHACLAEMEPAHFRVPYTGSPPINLVSITNAEMGLNGKIPENWKYMGLGFAGRINSSLDITQVGLQIAEIGAADWLTWLTTEFYEKSGFDQPPLKTGERQENNLVWNLYQATSQGHPVDVALAEHGRQTLMVLLFSYRDERDALYETVFLPIVDSAMPVN
jgi:pimeloyl-ACP methyl ester carboxylesterase